MKNLLIIGARGFGREVYNMYLDCKKSGTLDCVCKGFLDSNSNALDGYSNYPDIISSVEDYEIQPDDVFVCALGDTKWKKHYVELVESKGGVFISIIDPTVNICMNTTIGRGCIIRHQTNISCDISIGNFVTIMSFASLGHDVKVADFAHIGAHCFMGGGSQLGELSVMHPGSRVIPHVKIEDNAVVGAGSTVIRKVKSGKTVIGLPASEIKL